MSAREGGGSRFLYDSFDAANARIEANERVLEERWQALTYRLEAIETAIKLLERRLWLAVFGVVSMILAQAVHELIRMSSGG